MENLENNILDIEKSNDCGKIIKFTFPQQIKDEDINSLFMGILKLVKRNAICECDKKYKMIINSLKREIGILKLENSLLKGE